MGRLLGVHGGRRHPGNAVALDHVEEGLRRRIRATTEHAGRLASGLRPAADRSPRERARRDKAYRQSEPCAVGRRQRRLVPRGWW